MTTTIPEITLSPMINLVNDPSFEESFEGSGHDADVVHTEAWASSGTHSIRVTANSTNIYSYAVPHNQLNAINEGLIVPGETYTFMATLRLDMPLTGDLHQWSRSLVVDDYTGSTAAFTTPSPNMPGVYKHRLVVDIPYDSPQVQVRLMNGSRHGNGDVWWDDFLIVKGEYYGPYFDGDKYTVIYDEQKVFPRWKGEPNKSQSEFLYYSDVIGPIGTVWHEPTQRVYSAGVDRGMIYLQDTAVPWSGLVSVETQDGEEGVVKRYIDGRIYDVRVPPRDYSSKVEAFTYPIEFDACLGNSRTGTGLVIHGQRGKTFDMTYRTDLGDANGRNEYIIHILYGCTANPSGQSHNTINDSPEAETFSFEINSIPVTVPGHRPSAYFTIDSREVNRALLNNLENVLYGTEGTDPALPDLQEIMDYLNV